MTTWLSESLRKFRDLVVVSDLTVIVVTFDLTTYLKFRSNFHVILQSAQSLALIIALPFLWIINLTVVNAWETVSLESRKLLTVRILSAGWRTSVMMAFLAYCLNDPISRLWLLSQVTVATFLMCLVRILVFHVVWEKNRKRLSEKYILVSAPGKAFPESSIPPRRTRHDGDVVYVTIEAPTIPDYEKWLEDLKTVLKNEKYDGIIIAQGAVGDPALINEISHLYMLGVSAIIMQSPVSNLVARIKPLPHANWVRIVEPHLSNNGAFAKRVVDLIGSIIFIVIFSPVMLLAAIALKLTSKGPILYNAHRVGQDNNLFLFPKFRTMYQDADERRLEILGRPDENMTNRYANDPRITPVGRFLRRWSIDELPQFFCVLIGTMSLVGPRPILPEELEQITASDHYRFIAKPGLTGIWQVSGRKEVQWQERMAQDTYYIENWNPLTDFYILVRTATAIFSGKGAM